jgi:hypothetical protein
MERAAFYAAWREKKLRGLVLTAAGSSGNAATRVETFIYSRGAYAYGGYPDIDELYQQQAQERDRAKREALLHHIQQLTVERVMFAPIVDLRALMGVGYRVAEHGINLIPLYPLSLTGGHAAQGTIVHFASRAAAFQVAQYITVLHQGRLLADGSPEVIRRHPTVAEIYLGVQ